MLFSSLGLGGDGWRWILFAQGSTGNGGGGRRASFLNTGADWFWGASTAPSNVGIAVAITAMAGIALAATVVYSRSGSLKSPWSRRRKKHSLLPKQWKSFFTQDGKVADGGAKFLKKVRSGGVDPSIRAEVWPFLLGVYDLKSSKEERDSFKSQKRKEYVNLRKQCRRILRHGEKSLKMKGTSGNTSKEVSGNLSQVLYSPSLDEGLSKSPDWESPLPEEAEHPVYCQAIGSTDSLCDAEKNGVTFEDTESTDSDSSEEVENSESFLTTEKTEDNDIDEHAVEGSPASTENQSKFYTAEDFVTWQRIIRLDALRANDEWIIHSPSQAGVSTMKAHRAAESVGLKDYDNLEPSRIYHSARLVAILEAYALYDLKVGYCQGMSDLLSPIVSVVEEDDVAFWCFVGFMKKARHNFRLDEVGIRRQLGIVSKIIKYKDIHLYKHLEKLEAEDCFFVYRMVVVLFRRELSFEQTICLWEVIWSDQAAIRARIGRYGWGRMRARAPPSDDLLLYAIAACVLQRRKLIIEKYSSMEEIMKECNNMAGHLDVWKLLDDAHDLVVNFHDKI